jgi:transcriptional regulator with XRE-family HTH domain
MLDANTAERLRRIEMPQSAFAAVVEVSSAALSLYVNGRVNPSPGMAERIMSTLRELERISKLLPYLPNFRGVARTQALLLALKSGELEQYSRIAQERAVTAVSEQSAPVQPGIPQPPVERPASDPTGYQIRTP